MRARRFRPPRSSLLRHHDGSRAVSPNNPTCQHFIFNFPASESKRNTTISVLSTSPQTWILCYSRKKPLTAPQPQAGAPTRGLPRCPFNTVCTLPTEQTRNQIPVEKARLQRQTAQVQSLLLAVWHRVETASLGFCPHFPEASPTS